MSKKKKKSNLPAHHRKDYKIYPSFTYPQKERLFGHVPQLFIDAVKDAARHLEYDDPCFIDYQRKFYRHIKNHGFQSACMSIGEMGKELGYCMISMDRPEHLQTYGEERHGLVLPHEFVLCLSARV
jgi:hypothetical protein